MQKYTKHSLPKKCSIYSLYFDACFQFSNGEFQRFVSLFLWRSVWCVWLGGIRYAKLLGDERVRTSPVLSLRRAHRTRVLILGAHRTRVPILGAPRTRVPGRGGLLPTQMTSIVVTPCLRRLRPTQMASIVVTPCLRRSRTPQKLPQRTPQRSPQGHNCKRATVCPIRI